jgi:hypothetical protein
MNFLPPSLLRRARALSLSHVVLAHSLTHSLTHAHVRVGLCVGLGLGGNARQMGRDFARAVWPRHVRPPRGLLLELKISVGRGSPLFLASRSLLCLCLCLCLAANSSARCNKYKALELADREAVFCCKARLSLTMDACAYAHTLCAGDRFLRLFYPGGDVHVVSHDCLLCA